MKKTPILAALVAALFAVSSAYAAENLADRHAKLGFKCETCHAGQATPSEPPMEACTGCHQIEALVEKTKNVKPTNPHVSPHYHEPARFAPLRQHARMRQLPHDARRKHEFLRPMSPV